MIHEYLSHGAQNAKTGRELCVLVGVSQRELMRHIERERRAGYPICASTQANPGYFLAADQDELLRYCGCLFKRAGELQKTRRVLMKAAAQLPAGTTQSAEKSEEKSHRKGGRNAEKSRRRSGMDSAGDPKSGDQGGNSRVI